MVCTAFFVRNAGRRIFIIHRSQFCFACMTKSQALGTNTLWPPPLLCAPGCNPNWKNREDARDLFPPQASSRGSQVVINPLGPVYGQFNEQVITSQDSRIG